MNAHTMYVVKKTLLRIGTAALSGAAVVACYVLGRREGYEDGKYDGATIMREVSKEAIDDYDERIQDFLDSESEEEG